MSFDSLMTDTFTSQRRTLTGTDSYGQPTYSWANHLIGQKCLIQANRGAVEETIDVHGNRVISTHRLYCRIVDVVEGDRIVVSGGEGGPTFGATTRTFDILSIEQAAGQHHHIQFALRAIEPEQE